MDGTSLLPFVKQGGGDRGKPMGFYTGSATAMIDGDWKLMSRPEKGQCDYQPPYSTMKKLDDYYLFNLASDRHELHDLKHSEPAQYSRMQGLLQDFLASVHNSQHNETRCAK